MSEPELEPRVTDVEVRLAFMERTLSELDLVLRELADTVYQMQSDLKAVRGQVALMAPDEPGSLQDEKPPHY